VNGDRAAASEFDDRAEVDQPMPVGGASEEVPHDGRASGAPPNPSAAQRSEWPEGGLPHGEHPYDYGYGEPHPDDESVPEFDEWANAGRYYSRTLYPVLKPEERDRG